MEHRRLTTREAATYVGLSERTLEKLRIAGGGPEYFKPNRRVVYDRCALDAWLAGKRRRSTSDNAIASRGSPLQVTADDAKAQIDLKRG